MTSYYDNNALAIATLKSFQSLTGLTDGFIIDYIKELEEFCFTTNDKNEMERLIEAVESNLTSDNYMLARTALIDISSVPKFVPLLEMAKTYLCSRKGYTPKPQVNYNSCMLIPPSFNSSIRALYDTLDDEKGLLQYLMQQDLNEIETILAWEYKSSVLKGSLSRLLTALSKEFADVYNDFLSMGKHAENSNIELRTNSSFNLNRDVFSSLHIWHYIVQTDVFNKHSYHRDHYMILKFELIHRYLTSTTRYLNETKENLKASTISTDPLA